MWVEKHRVHSFEVDINKKLTLECLCRLFQEAAWNHAEYLKFGHSTLNKVNKIWVLSRLAIQIERMPLWGEYVELQTWPRAFNTLNAYRDFTIYDMDGCRVAGGSSAWLIIDAHSRRPQRVDKYLGEVKLIEESSLVPADPPKLTKTEMNTEPLIIKTTYGDIDMNGHVNNTRYAAWALNSLSLNFHRSHCLKKITINYLLELGEGEEVGIYMQKVDELEYAHSIYRLRDTAELCRVSSTWETLNEVT